MKKNMERQTIFIENMNGFPAVVQEIRKQGICAGIDLIEGEILDLINGELTPRCTNIIGVVKGPRSRLTSDTIAKLGKRLQNPIISYIGRHPAKILDPSYPQEQQVIDYTTVPPTIYLKNNNQEFILTSLGTSPLSSAVAAFVVGVSRAMLGDEESRGKLADLLISNGNNFHIRRGHNFLVKELGNTLLLNGLNVSVIGAGDIGTRVIRLFNDMGAHVSYSAKSADIGNRLEREALAKSKYMILDELIGAPCDILTLHVTSGLKIPLEKVKQVGLFVNTSAGSNIDTSQLLRALQEGRIKRAVVDVFDVEGSKFPLSTLNPEFSNSDSSEDKVRKKIIQELIEEQRLFLTPHIAYNEYLVLVQALKEALNNVKKYHQS